MNHGRRLALIAALLLGTGAPAQVIEPGYRLALPGYDYAFPRDHGAHPEYKLEWWYYTGHLAGADGRRFGYELTFFRIGMDRVAQNPSAWTVDDLHVAHFALSELPSAPGEPGRFRFFEIVNREGPGIAHARPGTLDIRNASWTARLDDNAMRLRAYAGGILLELELTPEKPPAIHGPNGVSQKADGEGQASHYYSMTRMTTTGIVSLNGDAVTVSGESWMDHEFGTNQLAADQVGWDWFSLQLDNGQELMFYRLRRRDGGVDPNSSGTLILEDGSTRHLTLDAFDVRSFRRWESPQSGAVYPLEWELTLDAPEARLRVVPLMDDQELVTTRSTGIAYWEGAVRVEGTMRGMPVRGQGYVELTGYREEYRPDV